MGYVPPKPRPPIPQTLPVTTEDYFRSLVAQAAAIRDDRLEGIIVPAGVVVETMQGEVFTLNMHGKSLEHMLNHEDLAEWDREFEDQTGMKVRDLLDSV